MNFTKSVKGNHALIEMNGKFTFSDHADFKDLFELFKGDALETLEFDVEKLDFVDSAALGLLLLVRDEAEKHSTHLILIKPTGQVKKMFEISRFYELFDVKE